jgi:histone H3/H4
MARTKQRGGTSTNADTAAKNLKMLAKAASQAKKAPKPAEPSTSSSDDMEVDIQPSVDLVAAVTEASAEPKKKRKRSKNPGPKEKQRRHEVYLRKLLRKVRDMQRGGKLLLAKAPFQRFVREEAARHSVHNDTRFKKTAMEALQEGAEAFITQYFEKAARSAAMINTMTVMPNHMLMAGEMIPELPYNVRDEIRLALFHVRDDQIKELRNEEKRTSQLNYTEEHEEKKPAKFTMVQDVNAMLERAEGKGKAKKKSGKASGPKAAKGVVSPPIADMDEDAEAPDDEEEEEEEESPEEDVAVARPVQATAVSV